MTKRKKTAKKTRSERSPSALRERLLQVRIDAPEETIAGWAWHRKKAVSDWLLDGADMATAPVEVRNSVPLPDVTIQLRAHEERLWSQDGIVWHVANTSNRSVTICVSARHDPAPWPDELQMVRVGRYLNGGHDLVVMRPARVVGYWPACLGDEDEVTVTPGAVIRKRDGEYRRVHGKAVVQAEGRR